MNAQGQLEMTDDEVRASAQRETTVLVVDDHRTFSEAIAMALGRQPDLRCVGTAGGVEEALALVHKHRPDVVVIDVNLGDGNGVAATPRLLAASPTMRVVVLSGFVTRVVLQEALTGGASAVLPKDGRLEDLFHAVRTASRDRFVVPPTIVGDLVALSPPAPADGLTVLTTRETEVLEQLARGVDTHAAAEALGISVLTCRGHIKSILVKLDAHTQLEAVVVAHRRGLVRVGD
jgi:DNA-binding NarL/FixJ family response regulator